MKILLVEPNYKNKYPPLGLMKLSSFHKDKGDGIEFCKGLYKGNVDSFDRIYITTLFTFYWKKTLDTIYYYTERVKNQKKVYVGGIMASILYEELMQEFGDINVVFGFTLRCCSYSSTIKGSANQYL